MLSYKPFRAKPSDPVKSPVPQCNRISSKPFGSAEKATANPPSPWEWRMG